MLYECLTGRVPFRGETGAAVALARLHSDPVDPRRVRADVPSSLAAPIMRVLSRDPDERYDSAADLRAALLDTGMPPLSSTPPAPPEPDDEPTAQNQSFARSERSWLVPTLFILLIATAITVAGLLLRETTIGSQDPPSTSVPAEPSSRLVPFSDVAPVDPQGRGEPGENDELAASALDGDPATGWRTETYDSSDFFGSKTGVGLALTVGEPTQAIALAVDGSTNGWSAQLYVLDQAQIPAEGLSELDPEEFSPVALLEDVRQPVRVALGGREVAEDDVLLLWITNLGEPVDGDRYRVEINEVALQGRGPGRMTRPDRWADTTPDADLVARRTGRRSTGARPAPATPPRPDPAAVSSPVPRPGRRRGRHAERVDRDRAWARPLRPAGLLLDVVLPRRHQRLHGRAAPAWSATRPVGRGAGPRTCRHA